MRMSKLFFQTLREAPADADTDQVGIHLERGQLGTGDLDIGFDVDALVVEVEIDVPGNLDVGAETVKWHLKHLFNKLGAANHQHAVDRARLLGIIE